ncbi:AAEL014376-PA, partial [Aedes aegypti]
IRSFIRAITEALSYFKSQASFEQAAAYVSRFCVRWGNRFYNMHGFRLLKRLNQSLLRYRTMDLVRVLTNLNSLLPDENYLEKVVQLPTRANLDYLLVRLQGTAKLFCRIIVLSKDAARYFVRFMSTGYFFNVCSLFLCLLAEVWYKSREICQRIVLIYNQLHSFRSLLENTAEEWPSGIECLYPEDLGAWLGDEFRQEVASRDECGKELPINTDANLFLLLSTENPDLSTAKKVDARIAEKLAKPTIEADLSSSIPKALLIQKLKTDEGESIERVAPATSNKPAKKPQFDMRSIRSKFDVRKFLDEEKAQRRQDRSQALTRDVADNVFNAFASGMARDLNRMGTGDLLQVFKQELTELVKNRLSKGNSGKSKKNKRFS